MHITNTITNSIRSIVAQYIIQRLHVCRGIRKNSQPSWMYEIAAVRFPFKIIAFWDFCFVYMIACAPVTI